MDFKKVYTAYTHKVYRSPRNIFQRHSSKNRKISMFIILIVVVGTLVLVENEKEFKNEIERPLELHDSTYIKKEKPTDK